MEINTVFNWKKNNHINYFHKKTILQGVNPEKHWASYYMGDSYIVVVCLHTCEWVKHRVPYICVPEISLRVLLIQSEPEFVSLPFHLWSTFTVVHLQNNLPAAVTNVARDCDFKASPHTFILHMERTQVAHMGRF